MENLALVSSPKLVMGYSSQNPRGFSYRNSSFGTPLLWRESRSCLSRPRYASSVSVTARSNQNPGETPKFEKSANRFARISSSSGETTSAVANPPVSLPSPPSHVGSPLFWIGVGVGLSALFSFAATNLKKYAMQQAFKTMMGQMSPQNNQFNSAAPLGSPFPFSTTSASGPAAASPAASSKLTVDVSATKVEGGSATNFKDNMTRDVPKEPKKHSFVDISPEETSVRSPFADYEEQSETSSSKNAQSRPEIFQNGAAFKESTGGHEESRSTKNTGPVLSVDALEKMMEDPTVQKMVYPYLPEEMRNPASFKWMLQNPQYRQQLEGMLNNMSGSGEWDGRMADTLKNFDISSPEVKQQFDQIGLTPEEVISKIMANPEVAMAFQNPRVQAAIMDCSQNPLSIAKYQNDKEVMDVFNKISELFPGVAGSP